ncbi:MAG: YraN family protein [Chitinophagales bacterium]|jgi:putative endonuclease|nr:YraN family protein [Chitinophagales bacterium]
MQKTSQTGSSGEYLAQEYLKNKNYTILFINWRHKRSEIDIIAQDGKVIVFVEVKTRTNLSFGHPENFVDANKIKKMQQAADAYIELFDWQGELRYDIIAVEKNNKITHFEDAFY